MGYKAKKRKKTHAQEKPHSSMMKKRRRKKKKKYYSHVLKKKLKGREIIQQGVHISISSTLHTLAHLDQIV
jgi:hypothetical protein